MVSISKNKYVKYIENGKLTNNLINGNLDLNISLSSDIKTISPYCFAYAYYISDFIKDISFTNVEEISNNGLEYTFYNCTSLVNLSSSFPSLTTIGQAGLNYCFYGCKSLTTAPTFANLTTVGQGGMQKCFQNCTSLTTAPTFANLTSIGYYGLSDCFISSQIAGSISFPKLSSISHQGLGMCFANTKITSLSFPSLTSTSFVDSTYPFNSMLFGVTGCTVHFPSNLQSVIGSWTDVTNGFGGTNTTVLFDLPATT